MAMAMAMAEKGSATPLASIFPVEEAQKASKRVQEKIAEKQQELLSLRSFVADNTSLLNLVDRLPDHLHHNIMVPFGKAAFFPGRLIHTNEFLVLLGEGYYAERTSRQTMEILKRRGKALDAQIDSLKATMQDLEAEASFFSSTAAEAAEGLVEIIEDYVEENSTETESESCPAKPDSTSFSGTDSKEVAIEDEEYARLMSRLEELEKEELADESRSENDEDDRTESDSNQFLHQNSIDNLRYSQSQAHQLGKPARQSKDEHTYTKELLKKNEGQPDFTDQLNFQGLKIQSVPRDTTSHEKNLSSNLKKSSTEKVVMSSGMEEENILAGASSKNKAFTGSIIERTQNVQTNPGQQSSQTVPQTSKPVSRFKMQRR